MITTKTTYETEDGLEFQSLAEAEAHEAEQILHAATLQKEAEEKAAQNILEAQKLGVSLKVLRYLQSYTGQALLEHHNLDETGVWYVEGIGYFKGTLRQVLEIAVLSDKWAFMGSGGNILMYKPPEAVQL